MDRCNTCGGNFQISQLCKDKNYKFGYRRRCHGCQREMMTSVVRSKNSTNLKKRNLVRTAKNKPCADCNLLFPYYVMDLDHLPKFQKCFSLGKYISYTIAEILLEISKCEAVCANCHRFRTHERGY